MVLFSLFVAVGIVLAGRSGNKTLGRTVDTVQDAGDSVIDSGKKAWNWIFDRVRFDAGASSEES